MFNNYHKIMKNKFWIINNLNKCLYKLNNNYPEKLDKYIKGLNTNITKDLDNGSNINR